VKLVDFRNKKKEYLKVEIDEFGTNSKFQNIRDLCRGISDSKKGYHLWTNTVKDENGNLVRNSHSVLAGWRKHFCQLLIVHGFNDVRQTDTYRRGTSA